MLATIFVASGSRGVLDPDQLTAPAKRVSDRLSPLLERAGLRMPADPRTLVQIDHAVKLAGGLALLTPLRRPAALALAASLVPTTLASHDFWQRKDPADRGEQQAHFMKNMGLFGGLLLAASDTQGRPDLRWRAGHAMRVAGRAKRTAVGAKRVAGSPKRVAAGARRARRRD